MTPENLRVRVLRNRAQGPEIVLRNRAQEIVLRNRAQGLQSVLRNRA